MPYDLDAGGRSALQVPGEREEDEAEVGTARVLVVDDERKIRDVVGSYLAREGYTVLFAETGEAALDLALREHPDLVVLDLKLPDLAGEEVARAVRKVSELPIIMLTAKSAEADRLAGLALGADDYLVKPFSVRELAARVAAVLRRTKGLRSEISIDGGKLVIDPAPRTARLDGVRLTLTRTEFDLLLALVSGFPRVLSREQLLTAARGYRSEPEERTIDAHVKNLRRKLRDDPKQPRYIHTAAGVGYRFGLKPDA